MAFVITGSAMAAETIIDSGTYNSTVFGGEAAVGNGNLSNIDRTDLTITGGLFNSGIYAGSYASSGGIANVGETNLLVNGLDASGYGKALQGGGLNSSVTSTNVTIKNSVMGELENIDIGRKWAIYGGSRASEGGYKVSNDVTKIFLDNCELAADIMGGGRLAAANTEIHIGSSSVEVNNTSINGFATERDIWTGRIYGGGLAQSSDNSITKQNDSNVKVNNVTGKTYKLDSNSNPTIYGDTGVRVYGGNQLYRSKNALSSIESTNVEINGEGTALSQVVGGGIISGTIAKDKVSTLVTGKTNIVVNDGNIATLLIGGNNTNWFGSSVVGVLNENGDHEYNGYKFNDGETNVTLNNGGNGDSLSVIGGSFADYAWDNDQNGKREALVFGNTNVIINGGEALEVIGAGYADYYTDAIDGTVNDDAPLSSVIGNTNVVINGGIITENVYGGGFAYSNQEVLASKANLEGNANVTISNGEIGGSVIAGGRANGNGTEAKVTGTATINMSGGSVDKDIVLGGLTEGESANANVAKAVLNYAGGSIGGAIYSDANTSEINILSGATLSNAIITKSGVSTLKINDGAIWNLTKASSVTSATFGAGSTLVIDGTKFTENYAITGGVTVKDGAKLEVYGVDANTYKIVNAEGKELNGAWAKENIVLDNALMAADWDAAALKNKKLDLVVAPKTASQIVDSTGVSSGAGSMLGSAVDMASTGNVPDASKPAIDFIVNAMAGQASGNTPEGAGTAINSALQIGEAGGNSGTALSVVNNVAGVTTQRLSFSQMNTAPQGGHGKVERKYKSGAGVWAQYMHGKDKVEDMPMDSLKSSYESQYNGAVIGYDFKEVGKTQTGIAFNYGEGDSHSTGGSIATRSDFDFWGIGLYHNIMNDDTNLILDVNYSKSDSDVTQINGGTTLTANPETTTLSAGVKFEKLIQNGPVQIVPYAGLRFMSVDTDDYAANIAGKKAFMYAPDRQNIWLIPVGVSLRQENTYENGWRVTPKADLSYIWAVGDTDSSMTVSIPGITNVANMNYTVMDNGSFLGTLGIEAEKGDWTYGLSYSYQKGEYQRSDKWFVDVRYSF